MFRYHKNFAESDIRLLAFLMKLDRSQYSGTPLIWPTKGQQKSGRILNAGTLIKEAL